MKSLKRTLFATLFLSCTSSLYADGQRVAFIFSSFRDQDARDPIDKNVTWRNTATTYQAIRDLGIPKEEITLFYNDKKPHRDDNSIALKQEMDAQPLEEGTYDVFEKIFREKTKNLTKDDEVILTTITHGGDDGVLYPDYGDSIGGLEISLLVNKTKARTVVFYSACYGGSLLDRSASKNAVLVAVTDRNHLSWSDRNYCSNADFFTAFGTVAADTDKNGKVSFEEAATYASKKWSKYKIDFLDQYILTSYIYPNGYDYGSKEALLHGLSCDPVLKRGLYVPKDWTLEKK